MCTKVIRPGRIHHGVWLLMSSEKVDGIAVQEYSGISGNYIIIIHALVVQNV